MGGGGWEILTFPKGRGMQQKSFKIGACRTDQRQILELAELMFFDKNAAFGTEFWPKWGFFNIILTEF